MLHRSLGGGLMECRKRFELSPSAWKADMLTVKHQRHIEWFLDTFFLCYRYTILYFSYSLIYYFFKQPDSNRHHQFSRPIVKNKFAVCIYGRRGGNRTHWALGTTDLQSAPAPYGTTLRKNSSHDFYRQDSNLQPSGHCQCSTSWATPSMRGHILLLVTLAGSWGFEPQLSILETDVLAIKHYEPIRYMYI